jgi:hypothetical protein
VILLPTPTLGPDNIRRPHHTLGTEAKQRRISTEEVRREALSEIDDYLMVTGASSDRFTRLLGLG